MKKSLLLATLVGVLALQSCSVPPMAVESSFKQQAEELPVTGRKAFKPNGRFNVGNYIVANVDRGWKNSGGFSILGYENIKSSQKYQFSLQDGKGDEWYVFGISKLQEKNLKSTNGFSFRVAPSMEYYTSYFTSPESGQWQLLTVDPGHYLERNKFEGGVSNGVTYYEITPVYKFEGKSLPLSDIVGYEFKEGEMVIGAVQVVNNGKVWLQPNLPVDTRMVLASAMASLLLYDKLYASEVALN
ncbi:hypothetical protein [Pontibacter harenae]|uniref:hypothetical protein n=1 Tax=Pontibacter harenae TaxID=2894083 RepID=UPI001E60CA94|nr:hypothetical protein [Pontibacter harenae]MCC9166504.1 hypothetical protein [Pontibacter harenae]